MLFNDTFKTIAKASEGVYRDRGSKFVALAFPIESELAFKQHYAELKKLHSKANHHGYAWRLSPDRTVLRSNDDGEPSGTAGKPILNVLLSFDVTDVALVVVRYFGGTLLGVSGLINAYKSASEAAFQNAEIIEKDITESYEVRFDFELMNDIINTLKKFSAKISAQEYDEACLIRYSVIKSKADGLLAELKSNYKLTNKCSVKAI